MITIAHGNLLKADVDALVNTVNTEGVMGKGIALQFRRAYPQAYIAYRNACKAGEVRIGDMHVVDLGALGGGPRWIINFPTKRHWRSKSKIGDIQAGLSALADTIKERAIRSIAVPPLGCGNGGLPWPEVERLIRSELGSLVDVRVDLYSPDGAPTPEEMPNSTQKPTMTTGMAAVAALVGNYRHGLMEPFVRLVEVHKLMYFLQEAGEPLRLNFSKGSYGPYATNLRHVLNRMESHYITGFGDGQEKPTQIIDLMEGAEDEAINFLEGQLATCTRMQRVAQLIEGFEDPFGMELLGSVHWMMMEHLDAAQDLKVAVPLVQQWNDRKSRLMRSEHIEKAWTRLKDHQWDSESRSAVRNRRA